MECIHGWASCPPEILYLIFCFLDPKALANCMCVNYRWRNAADYVVERHNQWDALLDIFVDNKLHTFIKQYFLHPRQILRNIQLWHSVKDAKVKLSYTYNMENVLNIHVYRDKLIFVNSESAKYFDISTRKLIRDISVQKQLCVDFNENDHMLLRLVGDGIQAFLYLNGKNAPTDFSLDVNGISYSNIHLYKMHERRCYFITRKNVIHELEWNNNKWNNYFLARYYGENACSCALHVHRDDVYIVLRNGNILRVDKSTKSLQIVSRLDFAVDLTLGPVMFDEYSAVCGVNASNTFEVITIGNTNQMQLNFPGLMCAKQHLDVLLLGYENGTVDICFPKQMIKEKRSEISLDLKEFGISVGRDPSIKTLTVYEGDGYQYLFILTVSHIYQFLIKYPDFVINKQLKPELFISK